MSLLSPCTWTALLAGLLWAALAVHAGLAMRCYGRRAWVWIVICLFLSAWPAMVVSCLDFARQRRKLARPVPQQPDADGQGQAGGGQAEHGQAQSSPDAPADDGIVKCPHCGQAFSRQQLLRQAGQQLCPHCRLSIGQDFA